eukprot:1159780-Pelagomonas_calceolata.AAC.1
MLPGADFGMARATSDPHMTQVPLLSSLPPSSVQPLCILALAFVSSHVQPSHDQGKGAGGAERDLLQGQMGSSPAVRQCGCLFNHMHGFPQSQASLKQQPPTLTFANSFAK